MNSTDGNLGVSKIRDFLVISAIFALPLILLQPLQNVPMNDDWTYAWSVQNLLDTGKS